MYKKNTRHLQPALISAASELPEKQLKRLKASWAGTFYQEFFRRIDEDIFSVLYSDLPSRPNVPVNVLVGLDALKAGFGWSDAELYENYCFNLQVRYALGYDRLGDGDFEIRTLYNFRQRLSQYNAQCGENLLEKAFEQITDAQLVDLKVRTGMQRMDSTQIASNIVSSSRLRLLVEAIQRVERIMNDTDRSCLTDTLSPYIKGSAGQYSYQIKGREAIQAHLQQIGKTIYALLLELRSAYSTERAYQVLERTFTDHFHILDNGLQAKESQELTSDCLQSVDDLEATFRTKGKGQYKGYVANLTETCDPENELQLITKVQVAPNNTDDAHLLSEALPNLKERTQMETIYTDGGYGSPEADRVLEKEQVELIQTAIRGRKPNPDKLQLVDFTIKYNQNKKPVKVTCPQGQTVEVQTSHRKKAYVAHFDADVCRTCPLQDQCRARPGKRDPRHHLRFTRTEALAAKRRRRSCELRQKGRNLRAAVEATVRSVKHPFPAGKLPVRGMLRVTCMVIGSAAMTNIRRIQRHQESRIPGESTPKVKKSSPDKAGISLCGSQKISFSFS